MLSFASNRCFLFWFTNNFKGINKSTSMVLKFLIWKREILKETSECHLNQLFKGFFSTNKLFWGTKTNIKIDETKHLIKTIGFDKFYTLYLQTLWGPLSVLKLFSGHNNMKESKEWVVKGRWMRKIPINYLSFSMVLSCHLYKLCI